MYGAIIVMLGLMSLKKLDFAKGNQIQEDKKLEEVHTNLV